MRIPNLPSGLGTSEGRGQGACQRHRARQWWARALELGSTFYFPSLLQRWYRWVREVK